MFGCSGISPEGYLNEHGDFQSHYNNQLLCFDPTGQEWTDTKTSGTIPKPRAKHATTILNGKVWLYGRKAASDAFISDDFYQLDMVSLVWTKIQTGPIKPGSACNCSVSTATENRLVLHGGLCSGITLPYTWVFDVLTATWNQHTDDKYHNRFCHKGTEGLKGYVILTGGCSKDQEAQHYQISVERQPKSLQELSIKIIFEHRDTLPWRSLPKRFVAQIMCPGTESL